MKKMLFALSALVAGIAMQAQTLNSEGLYVDANGNLFTGKMTKMQQESKVEMTVKNGVAEGPAYYYYPNGKLMETGNFAAGVKDDKWVRYNALGGVSAIAFYKAGKKTGTWLVYDDKGNKRFEMNYNEGEKSGVWTSWNDSGQVASTKDYSKVN